MENSSTKIPNLTGHTLGSWDDLHLCPDCVEYLQAAKDKADAAKRDPFKPVTLTLAGGTAFRLGKGDLYFIASEQGPIKIGSSGNPQARLRGLQTSNPFKLELLAVIPDAGHREAEYHTRFGAHRLTGEWFTRCPEIEAEIARLSPNLCGGEL